MRKGFPVSDLYLTSVLWCSFSNLWATHRRWCSWIRKGYRIEQITECPYFSLPGESKLILHSWRFWFPWLLKGQLLPNFIAGYTGAFAFQAACEEVIYVFHFRMFVVESIYWLFLNYDSVTRGQESITLVKCFKQLTIQIVSNYCSLSQVSNGGNTLLEIIWRWRVSETK